jgi:hypothetical protein
MQTANEKETSMLVTGRRRRLGAWLLVGWLAYWFTTVAQACCISFAADPGSVGRTPAFHAGELANDSSGSPMLPSLPDLDCDALSAIGPGATNAPTAAIDRIDMPTASPLSSERVRTDDLDRSVLAPDLLHPPAFGVPLYLRNQRFLI